MAYRNEKVVSYKNIVICDDCGKESLLGINEDRPYGFDNRMNRTLSMGWTYKQEGSVFKNYCRQCKGKHIKE